MLQPFDERKFNALVPDGGNADCDHIKCARKLLLEDDGKDLSSGLLCLLQAFEIFQPRLYHDMRDWGCGIEKWYIHFTVRNMAFSARIEVDTYRIHHFGRFALSLAVLLVSSKCISLRSP